MGLLLFPGDGDNHSPDASWSYRGFAVFRRSLAEAEGFVLAEMTGFGGERPWVEVPTVLKPLLDHPDVGGDDLSPADCAAICPRLEAIADQWAREENSHLRQQHITDAHQLACVLQHCIQRAVPLVFL